MSHKIKIRMGMCGVSGTSLMFLSELLDGSGEWVTNPGCVANETTNEYNGSPHLVYCEEGSEISPRLYNEQSILFCKSAIHRFLPHFDCPEVYQIDISDEESFQFVFDMRFLKKYLAGDFARSSEYAERVDSSNIYEELIQPNFPYITKYSFPVVSYVESNLPKDLNRFKKYVAELYTKNMMDSFALRRTPEARVRDIKDLSCSTQIHLFDWEYDREQIEKHTKLHVINYSELFLEGKDTGTVFDNYKKEIKEYTDTNWETIHRFLDDFGF